MYYDIPLSSFISPLLHILMYHLLYLTIALYVNCSIGPVRGVHQIFFGKVVIILLLISLNICLWCSKEPSHGDDSFEYQQHMFWLRNKKINVELPLLSQGL